MKKLIKENVDVFLFIVCAILVGGLFRFSLELKVFSRRAFITDLSIIVMISSVLWLFKSKLRIVAELILIVILSLLAFSQMLHFEYFNNLFSLNKIVLIGELLAVRSELALKIEAAYFIYMVPIVILALGLYLSKSGQVIIKYKQRIVLFILMFTMGFATMQVMLSSIKSSDDWTICDQYLYESVYSRQKFVDRFGLLNYTLRDATEIYRQRKRPQDATQMIEVGSYLENQAGLQNNQMTGYYKGKNLILIQAESLAYEAIDKDMTPTLYQLANEGMFFANHYAPRYVAATGDSEFIALTSMFPSVDEVTAYTYHRNAYPYALPNLFRNSGYSTNSYHNYISNFYNREIFHESLGFSTFYDMEKLGIHWPSDYIHGTNWLTDDVLFKKTVSHTIGMTQKPFFGFVITVSGHMPYTSKRSELQEALKHVTSIRNDLSDEVASYYASQYLLDLGLKTLMNELEANGLLNDTVLALYSDHYPYGLSDAALDSLMSVENPFELQKAPLIIWSADANPLVISKTTSTFDIYPTLCNLFDLQLDTKNTFSVGIDAFSKEEGIVYFSDMSWLSERVYYDVVSNETLWLNDDNDDLYLESMNHSVMKVFEIGQKVLEADYYGG